MTERKRPRKTEASFDLGFGGLFKGLGDFLDLLSQVVEASEEEVTRSDEGITRSGKFRVKGLGQQAQGVYGFRNYLKMANRWYLRYQSRPQASLMSAR